MDKVFKPGDKVIYIKTGEIFTIKEYAENVCGEGCCDCYLVEENEIGYWDTSLDLLESAP